MHILVIPSWYPNLKNPSNGLFCYQQAHALQTAGNKVGVIFPELGSMSEVFSGGFPNRNKISVVDEEGIPTYRVRHVYWLPKVPNAFGYLWQRAGIRLFKRYIEENGLPDVVHVHTALWGGLLAWQIKKKFQVPYLITEHNTAYARNRVRPWHVRLLQNIFSQADGRIMVSRQLGELVEKIVGPSVSPWSVIPNFIENSFADLALVKTRQDGIFTFINIAELTEKKGHFDLLRAFAENFAGDVMTQLKIAGLGHLRQQLGAFSQELGIEEQVTFLGHLNRKQVREELANADAFVLSSHYETFGIVVIEALASGKPVITTICGGPEGIVNQKNGLLVPPADVRELGNAMKTMKSNMGQYNPREIREECLSSYGEKAVMGKVAHLLRQISKQTN